MTEFVQVVVALPASHESTVAAVAAASVRAYREVPSPTWDEWLSGLFTKSVRRVKNRAAFDKVLAAADADQVPYVVVEHGCACAAAFTPMPADALPRWLARLQVQGLDAERHGPSPLRPESPVALLVNRTLHMSTGKTAAQVAHGLWMWLLRQPADKVAAWEGAGRPFDVVELPSHLFDAIGPFASDRVVDAGRTEVEPHTCTVLVVNTCE